MSGAALILLPPEPRMSDDARAIVRLSQHFAMLMTVPEKSAWYDSHMFDVDSALRARSIAYIAQACQDLDAAAARSRAIAAGFAEFSTAFAKGGFCQAGVVAPPDSLMGEKKPVKAARRFDGASR